MDGSEQGNLPDIDNPDSTENLDRALKDYQKTKREVVASQPANRGLARPLFRRRRQQL